MTASEFHVCQSISAPHPPRLLVSVRNGQEAQAALQGGADIIDVKEPSAGPLGQPALHQIQDVLASVHRRRPVSVALGDLPTHPCKIDPSVAFAKVGLAGCGTIPTAEWVAMWRSLLQQLPPSCQRVAVIYADWQQARAPSPHLILHHGQALGCHGLLIDTYNKRHGSLLQHAQSLDIAAWLEEARTAGWFVALAGSLSQDDLVPLVGYAPDLVGIRGAACRQGRESSVDAQRVSAFRAQLQTAFGHVPQPAPGAA